MELGKPEMDLRSDLQRYFEACRISYNANKFRSNVKRVRDSIIDDNKSGKLNFYDKKEKEGQVIDRLEKKYSEAGLSRDKIAQLIKYSDLESLDALDVHRFGLVGGIRKIREILNKFSLGDKSLYIGLSVALLAPAFLQGSAPDHLAEAFKGVSIDKVEVAIYALMSAGAVVSSLAIEKIFNKFLNKSFDKEGGIAEGISKDIAEFPPDEIKRFGPETVKNRVSNAKEGYYDLLKTLSFDIGPSIVMALTAFYNLWQRSPELAIGTGSSTLLMAGLDKLFISKSRLWEKHRAADETSENSQKQIEEQLSAHMEIVLAGEKDKFSERIKELMRANASRIRINLSCTRSSRNITGWHRF